MDYLTITDITNGLREKRFSAVEITRFHLDRIASRDASIGAYLHTMADDAHTQAQRVDAAIALGEDISTLAGVPMAIKDTILVAGHPCTASSKILEPYRAAYDATAVAKLKANDAVLLGKTNCDELAMGASTEHAALGTTTNPWDAARVPGGSSGGSVAAVAADLAVAALGSDTGGSIRQPASLCGVVGLKPTYGSVSRHGLIAMASSFDVIGPITRCVADTRTVFHAIRGRDRYDATSSDGNGTNLKFEISNLKSLRIGIPKEFFGTGMGADVAAAVRAAITTMEGFGCRVEEVSLPLTKYALSVYYVLVPSEVSANVERYDGIRYGLSALRRGGVSSPPAPDGRESSQRGKQTALLSEGRDGRGDVESARPPSPSPAPTTLQEIYTKTRAAGFGPEVKRRIMLGTYALSAGYADQYYKRALAVRNRIKEEYRRVFERVDVLVTPTSPTPAWPFGEKADDPLQMYLSDINTVSANVAGIPGLSLPCGFVERATKRLPVGLQLLGKWFDEDTLFTLGETYEQATSWHREHPALV